MPTLDSITKLADRSGEPDWMRQKRIEACTAFERLDLPTFKYGLGIGLSPELGLLLDSDPALLQKASRAVEVPSCAEFLPLSRLEQSSVSAEDAKQLFSSLPFTSDALAALHIAHVNDGFVVRIPASTTCDDPLVLDIPLGESSRMTHVFVVAEEASSATIVLKASGGAAQAHSIAVELLAHPSSHVDVSSAIDIGEETTLQLFQRGFAHRDASVSFREVLLGGSFMRVSTDIQLLETGANGRVETAFLGTGVQQLDLSSRIEHVAPHTRSQQTSHGLLLGGAHGVQHQTIHIQQDAAGSEAQESTTTLLLSDAAKMSPVPVLEVQNDDVSASHAATTGRIDKEALFYAQSRGISTQQATKEIATGHLSPTVSAIPYDDVRNLLHDRLSQRLA